MLPATQNMTVLGPMNNSRDLSTGVNWVRLARLSMVTYHFYCVF